MVITGADSTHFTALPFYSFSILKNNTEIYLTGAFVSEKTVDWGWPDSLGYDDNAVQIRCWKTKMECVLAEAILV